MHLFLFHKRMIVNFCSANDDVHIVYYPTVVKSQYLQNVCNPPPPFSRNMTHWHVFSLLIYLIFQRHNYLFKLEFYNKINSQFILVLIGSNVCIGVSLKAGMSIQQQSSASLLRPDPLALC